MEELRKYHWDPDETASVRTDVKVTLREGGKIYTNVALHLKGSAGSFRPIDSEKPAFTINFDKFVPGQRFHGLEKLHLNNSVQDSSFVSEMVSRELFTKAGVPAPRAGHALVEVNGKPPQLYVLVEGWHKQFFKQHFKNAKGNLYDGGAAHDVTHAKTIASGDDPAGHSRFQELVNAATNRSEQLHAVLDVERFLTFAAMEVFTLHWDGYCMNRNNYRVFHDLDKDRMVFLPHGMDQMFGVWRSTPTSPITPMMKSVVARAVMQSPEGRRAYLQKMSQLLTNVFADVPAITNRVLQLAARVRPLLGDNEGMQLAQERSALALADRIARRVRSVREQLRTANTPIAFDAQGVARLTDWKMSRESGSPSFSRQGGTTTSLIVNANGNMAYGSWRSLVLLDAGDYQFAGRFKTLNLQFNENITRAGVTLRVSGDRSPRMVTNAVDWTEFVYDFSVSGLADMELVCELRAAQGRAMFDADSLRLIRKGHPK